MSISTQNEYRQTDRLTAILTDRFGEDRNVPRYTEWTEHIQTDRWTDRVKTDMQTDRQTDHNTPLPT